MLKFKLLLVLSFSTLLSFAQKNIVSLSFNAVNSYRTVEFGETWDELDQGVWVPEVGIGYERQLSKRAFLLTGIYYTKKGLDRTTPALDPSLGYIYTEKQRFNYIELPLGIKYTIVTIGKKLRLNAAAEFSNQFLVRAVYTPSDIRTIPSGLTNGGPGPWPEKETKDSKKLREQDYNMYNIGIGGRIELLYQVNRIYIGVSPTLKYSILPVAKNNLYEPYDEQFYGYGIEVKVGYAF